MTKHIVLFLASTSLFCIVLGLFLGQHMPQTPPSTTCSADSDCAIGIQPSTICGCPKPINRNQVGSSDWQIYEPNKDYSNPHSRQVMCKPCAPLGPVTCSSGSCQFHITPMPTPETENNLNYFVINTSSGKFGIKLLPSMTINKTANPKGSIAYQGNLYAITVVYPGLDCTKDNCPSYFGDKKPTFQADRNEKSEFFIISANIKINELEITKVSPSEIFSQPEINLWKKLLSPTNIVKLPTN